MRWWMWAMVAWFGFAAAMLLMLYIMSWWYRRSIDREWKKYDRTL